MGLAAYEAHVLRPTLSDEFREKFAQAQLFHLFHTVGLLAAGLVARQRPSLWAWLAGALFTLGLLLFSGVQYAVVLSGMRPFSAFMPYGGMAWMLGWLLLALAPLRPRTPAAGLGEALARER